MDSHHRIHSAKTSTSSLNSYTATATIKQTKTVLSSNSSTTSSTSSINSCTFNVNFANNNNNGEPIIPPINPFEETNKFRLEQSVLSPNLFHVANTSTPERDSNSLWNIDQRAVLYPADIPTDESSLIAQYLYDNKLNKQVSAAVEAFWTQNKIIIESPLASTNGSALKAKFAAASGNSNSSNNGSTGGNKKSHKNHYKSTNSYNVSSPLSIDLKSNFKSKFMDASGNKTINNSNKISFSHKRDQVCQTMLSFPANLDITKIPALKPFLILDEPSSQINIFDFVDKDRESQLNNSIRKKLFDHNSDDLSTSTTTTNTVTNNNNLINVNNELPHEFMSPTHLKLQILMGNNYNNNKPKTPNTLPRPEIPSSSDTENNKIKSNTNNNNNNNNNEDNVDDWSDSFDFEEEHQFASSPKTNRFSKIMHDIGDELFANNDNNDENLNDSVFINNQPNFHRTPPDLSPLLATPRKQILHNPQSDASPFESCNNLYSKNLQHQHHNRYFHFETSKSIQTPQNNSRTLADIGSSLLKNTNHSGEKAQIKSPNLSPIRTNSSSSHNKKALSSSKKSMSSSSKKSSFITQNNLNESNNYYQHNLQQQQQKSIIFMEVGNGENININMPNRDDEEIQDRSFSESLSQHDNHYKREEFYTKKLYHDKLDSSQKQAKDTTTIVSDSSTSNRLEKQQQQQSFLIPVYQSDTSVQDQSSKLINNPNTQNTFLSLQNQPTKTCSKYMLDSSSKQPMNSMIETTTNTFNQDSQDTGYQTTSANCGANGSSSSSISCFQTSSYPSMMLFGETNNTNVITNKLFPLTSSIFEINTKQSHPNKLNMSNKFNNNNNNKSNKLINNSENQATVTSTPMSIGDELFNFNSYDYDIENNPTNNHLIFNFNLPKLANLSSNRKETNHNNFDQTARPLSNKNLNTKLNTSSTLVKHDCHKNNKKASISLNSLENIKPVESSTPEKLKQSITSFKNKLKSTSSSQNDSISNNNKMRSINFVKSKTSGNLVDNKKHKLIKKSISKSNNSNMDEYSDFNEENDDAYMSFNNSTSYSNDQQLASSRHNLRKKLHSNSQNQQIMAISCEDLSKSSELIMKKYELDSSYMDQSILKNKQSPSEYARSVLEKAKKYLNESNKFLESDTHNIKI